MDSTTLSQLLSKAIDPTKCYAAGVFPRDLLTFELFPRFPGCCIANIDDSSKPGQHWVAYYVRSANDYEFFDSFGLAPSDYRFPNDWISPTYLTTFAVQSDFSNACAHFCLYYLHSKTLGFSLPTIVRSFSSVNLIWNDKLVKKFVSKFSRPHSFVHSPILPDPLTQVSIIKRFVIRF